MRKFNKMSVLMLVILLCLSLFVIGCQQGNNGESANENGNENNEANEQQSENNEEPEEKGTVKLTYVNWAEGVAMTNLAKAILEDKMGYTVEMTMADAGPVYTSLASGSQDAFLDGWLPVTHGGYLEEYGDDLVDQGTHYKGARIGLVVPAYVDVDSIAELNDNVDKFNGEITGIDSGAGIMQTTEKAIEEYGLDYELIAGSGPAMTAALMQAVDNEEPIIVTGWKPHWKFARWDLKFLEDPDNVYGESENIHLITRTGLKDDMPEVTEFLNNLDFNDQQLGSLMGEIADSDDDPIDAAKAWMNDNEELVNEWIPQ